MRTFVPKGMVVSAVLACVAGGLSVLAGCGDDSSNPRQPIVPEQPNIIVITADDLGWRDTSIYGNPDIDTPSIDRLAREGVRFENAFVAASSCSPSRASFMTGQVPHTNGVTGLAHAHLDMTLPPFYPTLASILREAGYHTALEGKWHVAPYFPTDWYGYEERLSGILPSAHRVQDTSRTLAFLERNRDRRFYLELNYMNNHRDDFGNFQFDPDFPVSPDDVTVPEYWTLPDWPEIRLEVAKFYSQTRKMDHMIGEILDRLDELGIAETTIVVFFSDNGPPFPGNKMTPYDRGTGTPLIVRWPQGIRSGAAVTSLVSTIDILPTLLEAAGIPSPTAVEGYPSCLY
jgi:arylsulfatase A-like enzyme